MKRQILALALLILGFGLFCLSTSALAAEPLDDVGVHYARGPVAYENDRIIVMREGLSLDWKGKGHASTIYYKTDADHPMLAGAELESYKASIFMEPSYDVHERAAFKRMAWAQAADIATSGIGISQGGVELNPLFAANPYVMVSVKLAYLGFLHHQMARSPKFHSDARSTDRGTAVTAVAAGVNLVQILAK